MATLTVAEAESLVARALVRCRTSEVNAAVVARALVAAEADGLKGHGLSRVPTYAAQAKAGKVDGFAEPALSRPRPALVAVACAGFAVSASAAARVPNPSLKNMRPVFPSIPAALRLPDYVGGPQFGRP